MLRSLKRPLDAILRGSAGHWEGDLIVGPSNKSAIGTIVERKSCYVRLVHLPSGHDAPNVTKAICDVVSSLPEHLCRTLTWASHESIQGGEMAKHDVIAPLFQ